MSQGFLKVKPWAPVQTLNQKRLATANDSKRIRQLTTLYTFDLYKPFLLHCLYLVRQHNQQHRTNLMRNASMTNYKFGWIISNQLMENECRPAIRRAAEKKVLQASYNLSERYYLRFSEPVLTPRHFLNKAQAKPNTRHIKWACQPAHLGQVSLGLLKEAGQKHVLNPIVLQTLPMNCCQDEWNAWMKAALTPVTWLTSWLPKTESIM